MNLDIKDESETDIAGVVVNVDGGPPQIKIVSGEKEKYSGARSVEFSLSETDPHSVTVKLFGMPESQWSKAINNELKSISIDDGGRIEPSARPNATLVGFVGDSWMATSNDWPHLLDSDRYSAWPVTFGGATMKALSQKYLFNSDGEASTSEPDLGVVVVGAGVNDYRQGISVLSYGLSAYSLVEDIKDKHPEAIVALLQPPNNVAADLEYGKYGLALKAVAWMTGAKYLPFPEERLTDLTWAPDNSHLAYDGLKVYAGIVGAQIESILK